ncbi:ABC transporter permease [Flavisolibacter tropicus]|uniref:ABC transporter permease n=1 Tax=Flavisolibacter tropicus TaxID=1492898 RepID=A0A172TSH1_9BACT|nr:FtsX-like permease family protein [Flavisolibacter tropicus]ANE49737.1 ABC transporter permease [Flavisolibacter tropicus]
MNHRTGIRLRWLMTMAWRDSRRNRSRLFLFISSIILGIAALVAIYSLNENMQTEIDRQAASLIGADLEISSSRQVSPASQKLIDSLGDRRSEERSFVSMALFNKSGGTRLVQVKALQGEFPYYGALETEPSTAGVSFRNKQQALVDQTLMLQFKAQTGDSIQLGNMNFVIAGTLLRAPGQTGLSASVSPVVYIPLQYLEATGLSQKGSRIGYKFYYKYDRKVNIDKIAKQLEPRLSAEGLNYDTIASQKEETNRSFRDVTRFLSLIGFIALLLGCIGVASSIHIYIREKINSVAILRCLGASSKQSFLIFLIQIAAIGLVGSIVGAFLGTIIQQLLPVVLKEILPIDIPTALSWSSITQGILLGTIISILFALLPLVSIRRISPLNTLRAAFQQQKKKLDPVKWLIYSLVLLFIFGFALLQMDNWRQALFFTLGVILAFLILTGIAALLMYLVRRFFPGSWSYLWRQGLANLYRPNNQTTILIVSIGLGTAFICTLIFIHSLLLNRVSLSSSGHQPNMVLFDIQPAQKEQVIALTRQQGLPVNGTVPIVNMRLESINDITASRLQQDSTIDVQRWVFSREYRVTFRDTLSDSEKIAEGKWSGKADKDGTVRVSIEERFAKRNKIHIGDTMTFNVQGSIIPTIVGSLREVDWNRIQTNFLVVFPTGVLEDAPQFHVLLTRVPSKEKSAQFQQVLVKQFPNVSIIDLGLVLSVIDDVLSKVGFVIRFMAGFSIFTGLVVLIASVLISKYQRMGESVLLRTLGASKRQLFMITALEYFFLGAFAAATGIILSLIGSWALANYSFEMSFSPSLWPVLVVFLSVCALTVSIGLGNSREVLTQPPLEILRQEN